MQSGLLCNLPTSLGKEVAEGKGHSYWVVEVRTYAVTGKWVRGRKG